MKKLMIVYPGLTSYIIPVLRNLATKVQLDVYYSTWGQNLGFGDIQPFNHLNINWHQLKEFHIFGSDRFGMYQIGLIRSMFKNRPDFIIHWSNPRYISFWLVLVVGYFLKIPVFPRGHGLFKNKDKRQLRNLMYKMILFFSEKYICYTPEVKDSLESITHRPEKLAVDYNTLYNDYPVKPHEKDGNERGVFYIGRIRGECGVDVLIEAIAELNLNNYLGVELHVIGDGPLGNLLRQSELQYNWLHYYGKEFDQERISSISRKCRVGCVPGFMGLNVVHMMSLSLPVITHAQLDLHMGPEPEYIHHGENGLFYGNKNDFSSLVTNIKCMFLMSNMEVQAMQKKAYDTYSWLMSPPYHKRLLKILGFQD